MLDVKFQLNKNVIREDLKKGIYPSKTIMALMTEEGVVLTRIFETFKDLVDITVKDLLIRDNLRNISAKFEYKDKVLDCCIINNGEVQVTIYGSWCEKFHRYRTMADRNLDLDKLLQEVEAL